MRRSHCKPWALVAPLLIALCAAPFARACECLWSGPFLAVAPGCDLIVRARVIAHLDGDRAGEAPQAMDLEIRDLIRGRTETSAIRVWGDNGALCRPYVTQFPPGTEWLFALNGPGSKPGMSPGPALSICGQFWLEVRGSVVVGNIDGAAHQDAPQQSPLSDLIGRLRAALPSAGPDPAKIQVTFDGEIGEGEVFETDFGDAYVFRLEPHSLGWLVTVRERGREEDLSRLTPPLHGFPNPREIEGWHFRNADNTGPNEAGEKNVNAPGELREFIFSPEVGRTIAGPDAMESISQAEVDDARSFGVGRLGIREYRLGDLRPGDRASFEWMRFDVYLCWSAEERPGPR